MVELIAVNIGTPQTIPGKSAKTGIYKVPVDEPVEIDAQGLRGDAVLDRRHHGGVDQAVYVYFDSDYDWWREHLPGAIAPGLFGENLTFAGVNGQAVAVGDRFVIGGVVLEVTSHRTPCMVFAAKMGDPKFVKRFHKAGRPGGYCRVIVPGSVAAGMLTQYIPYAGERVTVSELMALDGERRIEPAFLRKALTAPVHYKMRQDFEERLAQLF